MPLFRDTNYVGFCRQSIPSPGARTRENASGSSEANGSRTPMRRIRSGCCARAANGHAAAPLGERDISSQPSSHVNAAAHCAAVRDVGSGSNSADAGGPQEPLQRSADPSATDTVAAAAGTVARCQIQKSPSDSVHPANYPKAEGLGSITGFDQGSSAKTTVVGCPECCFGDRYGMPELPGCSARRDKVLPRVRRSIAAPLP
jgi:hypothetical protein